MLSGVAVENTGIVYSDEKNWDINDDIDSDNDDCSNCSSIDTNECIEFFLGLKKNTIALNSITEAQYDDNHSCDPDCLESSELKNVDCNRNTEFAEKDNDVLRFIETNSKAREKHNSDDKRLIPTKWKNYDDNHQQLQFTSWFEHAYLTPAASCNIGRNIGLQQQQLQPQQHCVRIVYNEFDQYYSLIASCVENMHHGIIPKGTILYTESPLFATQIPSSSYNHHKFDCKSHIASSTDHRSQSITKSNTDEKYTQYNEYFEYYNVRACQCCFRSLETIESCYGCCRMNRNDRINQKTDPSLILPLQYLYPVPDFDFSDETTNTNEKQTIVGSSHRKDQYGRVQCAVCLSLFCSQKCYYRMLQQYGSCCSFLQQLKNVTQRSIGSSTKSLPVATTADVGMQLFDNTNDLQGINQYDDNEVNESKTSGNRNVMLADDSDAENDSSDPLWESLQQPAIALAVRMFVATLHQYRSTNVKETSTVRTTTGVDTKTESQIQYIVDGLCGSDVDVQLLEIGIPIRMNVNNNTRGDETESGKLVSGLVKYTVEPIYDVLRRLYKISTEEQTKQFTLEYFMSLCSKAARNGFGVRPQSPFQSYYAGIVRSSLCRGSTQHIKLQNQVANALLGCASSDAQFQRGMDRMIDERVCPEVVALYPLTSRINHSCVPNGEVRSQQYIDSTIDVVAIKDIRVGEEITISYIYGTGSNNSVVTGTSRNISNATTQGPRNHKSTHRRQQELYAKYLFRCDCTLCQSEMTSK